MHKIISSFRYQLAAVLLFVIIIVTWQQQQSWQIDVGTPSARVFTTTLRESESAQIDGKLTTFQWSLPHSHITLPPHSQPQIIWLRTIMRAESPPHAVTLSNANLQFALATTTGVRRYAFYATDGAQITIDCDMQGVSDSALTKICIAIDTIDGQPTNTALDWPVIGWMLILLSALALELPAPMHVICTAVEPRYRQYGIGALELPALGGRKLAKNRRSGHGIKYRHQRAWCHCPWLFRHRCLLPCQSLHGDV